MSLISTSIIVIAVGLLKYFINHGLCRGEDRVITARRHLSRDHIFCDDLLNSTAGCQNDFVIVFVIPR